MIRDNRTAGDKRLLMSGLTIREEEGGVVFWLKVVPGSSKTSFEGALGDKVKLKVASAPEKGKANQCLVAYLAKSLGVKKKDITIISGQTNAVKSIRVIGVDSKRLIDAVFGGGN
jgi:hypothetical protein